ncbi:hypothetical protein E4U41_002934 [Claviceps citrina]|nr:hypothetical protein E4U41_002934 [Claviceps citrina]
MDRLPRELIDAILRQSVALGLKNHVLRLRLVCRLFDKILKPAACRTLGLDFSRMSRASLVRRPDVDALQTIGYHCKSLYVDLMVLRDESQCCPPVSKQDKMATLLCPQGAAGGPCQILARLLVSLQLTPRVVEVYFLQTAFAQIHSMTDFCHAMHKKYCLNENSFTETEYYRMFETILFNCRQVRALRLNLPFQLVGSHCNAATMILANTLKALASRPEEDSASLETLVLENVTDVTISALWLNPSDVVNIMSVVAVLKHLILTVRRHDVEPQRAALFGSCLWDVIEHADNLESLCLVGIDHDQRPIQTLKQTRYWQLGLDNWKARSLPAPRVQFSSLTCLELTFLEVLPKSFLKAMDVFGETLEELYLKEIYLKTEQSAIWNRDARMVLWVGVPNQRPTEDCKWMAMSLRAAAPRLRICRASHLAYDHYFDDDMPLQPEVDLKDPCGLGRSLSQRFVEVVMGVHQPNTSSGEPVEFFPRDPKDDGLVYNLRPRDRALRADEYDTTAYQTAVANTTSRWHKSIDGIFPNSKASSLDELASIAETACEGMSEVRKREGGLGPGYNSIAEEVVAHWLNVDPNAGFGQ